MPSNETIANDVLCELYLYFQGQTFNSCGTRRGVGFVYGFFLLYRKHFKNLSKFHT